VAGVLGEIPLQLPLSAVDSEAEGFERMSTLELGVVEDDITDLVSR
jgi:hypothetical protein